METRIESAEAAVVAFWETRENGEPLPDVEREDTLTDLLTDLMHWSEDRGYSFERALRVARMHFEDEGGEYVEEGA